MTRTPRAFLAAGLAVTLLATGCSGDDAIEAAEHHAPTFRDVADETLRPTEPMSSVTDLLGPAAEGEPWRIVGSLLDPADARTTAAVWTSADGTSWDREDVGPADDDVGESMAAVARRDDQLVAVGRADHDDSPEGDGSDGAVWRRTPGGEGADDDGTGGWTLSTPDVMGGPHDQWAFAVAAGPTGILVAGGENAWGEIRPRLWFSPDGVEWESVDGGAGGPLDRTGEESIQAITAFRDGFVAVGGRDENGDRNGVVWFSGDGVTWEEVEAPTLGVEGDGHQRLLSVAVVQDLVVAGGYATDLDGLARPVVWRSADGRAWGRQSAPLPIHDNNRTAATGMSVRSMSASGDAILAAGGDQWRPQLWRSADAGVSWQLLPDPAEGDTFDDGVALDDIAGAQGATIAIGTEPIVMTLGGQGWVDRIGDDFPTGGDRPAVTAVTVDEETLVAAGYSYRTRTRDARRRYTGRIWHQDGGDDLVEVAAREPEEDQPPPPQSDPNQTLYVGKVNDVAPFDGGYVAVGFEDFSWAALRNASDKRPDGVIWTSSNGRDWGRQAASYPNLADSATVIAFGIDNPDVNAVAAATADVITSQPMLTDVPAGGPGTRSLEAVAPLGPGFIAVGSQYRDLDGRKPANFDTDPVVAVSTDGKTIVEEDSGLAGAGTTQRFRDVCVDPDGRALAVGETGTASDFDAAVRLRDTAKVWHEGVQGEGDGGDGAGGAGAAPGSATSTDVGGAFGGPGNQHALACAAGPDGFVVVGSDDRRGNIDARIWVSEDGMRWRRLSASSLGGNGDQEARAVSAVPADQGGGWLVGGVDTMGGDSDAALWRLDGDSVTRRDRDEPDLGGPGLQAVSDVFVTDDDVIVVGENRAGVGLWRSSTLDR